ncbi:MAG: hypothetical protein EHM91_12705, partial [Planctomycetota bacterium]
MPMTTPGAQWSFTAALLLLAISGVGPGPASARTLPAAISALDLGTLSGKSGSCTAIAVNSLGQVVGTADMPLGNRHAFRWSSTEGMLDLGSLGGNFSSAGAINPQGHVVG